MDEADRRKRLEVLRPEDWDRELFHGAVWPDQAIERLRAAYQVRFDEPIPRTETLMMVAAEGVRIWLEGGMDRLDRKAS